MLFFGVTVRGDWASCVDAWRFTQQDYPWTTGHTERCLYSFLTRLQHPKPVSLLVSPVGSVLQDFDDLAQPHFHGAGEVLPQVHQSLKQYFLEIQSSETLSLTVLGHIHYKN